MTDSRRAFLTSGAAATLVALAGCSKSSPNAITESTGNAAGGVGGASTIRERIASTGPTRTTRPAQPPGSTSPPRTNVQTSDDDALIAFALGTWGCQLENKPFTVEITDGAFTFSVGDQSSVGSWALEDGTLRLGGSLPQGGAGSSWDDFELVLTGVSLDAEEVQMHEYYENGKQEEISDPKVSVSRDGDSVSVERSTYLKSKCTKS